MATQSALRNLTKSELRLVNQSSPREIKKITPAELRRAHTRTEGLVKKYRTAMRGVDDKKRLRMLQFRLRSLEKALTRYSKNMDSTKIQKRKARLSRAKGDLMAQPGLRARTVRANGSVGSVRRRATSKKRRALMKGNSRRAATHSKARNQRSQAQRDYRH